jgi:cation:H+ antiporter
LLLALGDLWNFSPGLLAFVGAVGANVPNFTAALTAAAGGQLVVGQQIIVGSNIYNLTVILGIAAFAIPTSQGIVLERALAHDALAVARLALAMGGTTVLTLLLLTVTQLPFPHEVAVPVAGLTVGLFVVLAIHAFRRTPTIHEQARASRVPQIRSVGRAIASACLALTVALGSIVIMVHAGERFGATAHLSATLLGVVVLAVATSLPNTVVGFELAHTGRATSTLEELLSSNCVNLALGSALPVLMWSAILHDPGTLILDTLLMLLLTLILLIGVRVHHIPRFIGGGLLLLYLAWVAFHVAK